MAKLERISLSEAKSRTADWASEREQWDRDAAISNRFRDASATEVISMWETGKNERGRKLSNFEFAGLVERWCELFGALPPSDDDAQLNGATTPQPASEQAPEPEDDTMLRMGEVVRLTGISDSTIKRMVLDGRFPKPMRLSPRRIGWKAVEVKSWIQRLDDQRRAPRQ